MEEMNACKALYAERKKNAELKKQLSEYKDVEIKRLNRKIERLQREISMLQQLHFLDQSEVALLRRQAEFLAEGQ